MAARVGGSGLASGATIDGFLIGEQLHVGGMAELWSVTRPDIDLPLLMKIPLIRLVESAGGSVKILDQNAATKLPAYPTWQLARMMGKIPIVGLALGPCAGLGAIKAATAHYSVMVKGTSQVFAGGPPVVERGMGVKISKEDLGGSKVHTRESGVMGNEARTEEEAFEMARRFLSYLPSSVYEMPPVIACDDPRDRAEDELIEIIPRDKRKVYKSRKILDMVFD